MRFSRLSLRAGISRTTVPGMLAALKCLRTETRLFPSSM